MKKLAIIEDDRLFNEALYQFLVQSEYEIKRAFSFAEGILLIEVDEDMKNRCIYSGFFVF